MGKDLKGKELGKGICQRKLLSDYMRMVEQSAMAADSELYSYILKAVTEGTTFVVLKSLYDIPCERDMFYDRRRKFYFVLSGMREIYNEYYEKESVIAGKGNPRITITEKVTLRK